LREEELGILAPTLHMQSDSLLRCGNVEVAQSAKAWPVVAFFPFVLLIVVLVNPPPFLVVFVVIITTLLVIALFVATRHLPPSSVTSPVTC
jgi:hypothetical protein